jgi:hypothetical protein
MPTVKFNPGKKFGTFKWGELDTGEAGEVARLLYHGGIIHPGSIEALTRQRMMRVKSLGFMRELDLHRAWQYSDAQGRLTLMPGIQLWSYGLGQRSAPSLGPKSISIRLEQSKFGQVEITEVSSDYDSGIYPFKFKYPAWWSWDRAVWEQHLGIVGLDDNGTKVLNGIDGSGDNEFIRVKFADSSGDTSTRPYVFPDEDVTELVEVEGRTSSTNKVVNQGTLMAQYDGGSEVPISPWFEDVMLWTGGAFSLLSDNVGGKLAENHDETVDILQAQNDSIYIGSPTPFYGIEFLLETPFGAAKTLEVYYSNLPTINDAGSSDIGFSADMVGAAASSVTDGTSGLSQDGSIYWDEGDVQGWSKSTLNYNDGATDIKHSYYWIKIKVTSAAPGTCTAYTLRRHIRLPGSNGDYITIKVNPEALRLRDADEEIVIRTDSDGNPIPATWHLFASVDNAVTQLADIASFRGEILEQDDIIVSSSTPYLNVFPNVPREDYFQKITCILVDTADDDTVYLGVGKELWRYKHQGELEFLGSIDNIDPSTPLDDLNNVRIMRMVKDGTAVKGIAWTDLGTNHHTRIDSPCAVFTYTVSTGEFDYSQAKTGIFGVVAHEYLYRDGRIVDVGGSNFERGFGQNFENGGAGPADGGENLMIPYPQLTSCEAAALLGVSENIHMRDRDDFLNSAGLDYPAFVFNEDPVGNTFEGSGWEEGPYWAAKPGAYIATDGSISPVGGKNRLGFKYSLGQRGFVEYNFLDDRWYALEHRHYIDSSAVKIQPIDGTAGNLDDCLFFFESVKDGDNIDSGANIFCGQFPDSSKHAVYLSYIYWEEMATDSGTDAISVSYLSYFYQDGKAKDWPKAFWYNQTTTLYEDRTTAFNAGTGGFGTLNEVDDAIYVGDTRTFNSVYFQVTNSAFNATVLLEYWNGVAWAAIDAGAQNDDTTILTADGHWTWKPHRDWATTAVGGTTQYWVRFRVSAHVGGSTQVDGAQNAWANYWESRSEIAGSNRDAQSVIDFCHNPNESTIHGCIYDRSDGVSQAANNPNQYLYFVYEIGTGGFNYSTTGQNFNFETGRALRHFTYNSTDFNVYCIAASVRDPGRGAWLMKCDFTGGSVIEVYRLGIMPGSSYNSKTALQIDSNGGVFGVCGPGPNEVIFQYSDTLWPRVPVLSFGETTVTEAIAGLCQATNFVFQVTSERIMRIQGRNGLSTPDTFDAGRKQILDVRPSKRYEHVYRGISVAWTGTSKNGIETYGDMSDVNRILNVSNRFVQNPYYARILARMLFDYFKNMRYVFRAELTYLLQLELGDELTFSIPGSVAGIDTTKEWILWGIDLDTTNKKLTGTFLEKV